MTVPKDMQMQGPTMISLRLEERLLYELKRVARQNDRSVSAEVRQAVRDYLRDFREDEAA